jgi:hypothetical protein
VNARPKSEAAQRYAFRAVWPVIDPTTPMSQLLLEGAADLPNVARRHRAQLIGPAKYALRPGQDVPGSGGAGLVLVATAPATPIPRPTTEDAA